MNLKQFKLSNNDEVICEVVDNSAEDEGGILIRKAMRISVQEDYENNVRYYSFKPFITFQDEIEELVVMNVGHIISETLPSRTLTIHYARALKEVENTETLKKNMNLDELLDEIDGLTDEEMGEWVRKKIIEFEREEEVTLDSDSTNVIPFKPKGTFH